MSEQVGARVLLLSGHPWADSQGVLVSYETYGMGWKGWRILLDEPYGHECFARPGQFVVLRKKGGEYAVDAKSVFWSTSEPVWSGRMTRAAWRKWAGHPEAEVLIRGRE